MTATTADLARDRRKFERHIAETLAAHSDSELAGLYATAGPGEARAIEREMNARDARDRAHERQEAYRQVRQTPEWRQAQAARRQHGDCADWRAVAESEYLRAERDCKGELISPEGVKAGITSAIQLWQGEYVPRYCTEEMREWFRTNGRLTVGEYQRQAAESRAAAREAYEHDRLASDDTGPVRHRAEAGTGSAPVPEARRDGDTGHDDGHDDGPDDGTARRDAAREYLRQRSAQLRDRTMTAGTLAVQQHPAPVMRAQRSRIDGAQALGYARQFLAHFAVWPSEATLTAATLWAAHTHARGADKSLVFLSTPRLLFSSAEPGSGKSHAMKLVSRLCPDPVIYTEPSEPAIAHSIGEHQTIGLEEVDVLFGAGNRKAAIRAIINDGYTPDGQWARVRHGSVHRLCTFGPLMMAGLDKVESGTSGVMAATLSRCVRIKMRRAPEDYRPPRFDAQARYAATLISERLTQWAAQNLDVLAAHVPELDEIGNRQAELFEPLAVIADIAGGPWPQLMRDAADELITTGGMPAEDEDRGEQLHAIMASWDAGEDTL